MNLITLRVLFLTSTIVFAIFAIGYKDLFINFIILRWKKLALFLINSGQLGQLLFIHAARWHRPFDRLWTLIFNVFIYVCLVSLEIKPLLKHLFSCLLWLFIYLLSFTQAKIKTFRFLFWFLILNDFCFVTFDFHFLCDFLLNFFHIHYFHVLLTGTPAACTTYTWSHVRVLAIVFFVQTGM
jgi:hypothetical protein